MASREKSSVQYAYDKIKEWILAGFMEPGKKIDQDEIANRLGLSREPIRSALSRLNADGLAVVVPNHGAVVAPMDDELMNHLFDARAKIEAMTVICATKSAKTEDINRLLKLADYQSNIPDHSLYYLLEEDKAFHRFIAELSGNEVFLNIFDKLWAQSERYVRKYLQYFSAGNNGNTEHRRIAMLMAEGKSQEAADCVSEHTRATQCAIITIMEKPLLPAYCRIVSTVDK